MTDQRRPAEAQYPASAKMRPDMARMGARAQLVWYHAQKLMPLTVPDGMKLVQMLRSHIPLKPGNHMCIGVMRLRQDAEVAVRQQKHTKCRIAIREP